MSSELIDRIAAGEQTAVARAISKVEDGAAEAADVMKAVFPRTGRALIVGITGSPGAGKSTLVDKLAAVYRRRGERVGIIAVDPSSPFSGGAILGDRIRMQALALDKGVFIRSMATRGNLGGLSRKTVDAIAILDAAGYEKIIVETVGVGQDEIEIAKTADVCVVVLVPGMGDDVQTMKAGIMEIGDVLVINKADRDGVLRTEKELEALLSLTSRPDQWQPPIVKTVAIENQGIEELAAAIDETREFQRTTPAAMERRTVIARWRILELLREFLVVKTLNSNSASDKLDRLAAEVANRKRDPYSAVEELMDGMKIDHIGVATTGIDQAATFYRESLGLEVAETETVPDQKVRVAMLPVGEVRIELLEGISADSPISRFLEKRGPGIHHIALRVDDIRAALARLKQNGARLIDEEPRTGAGGCLVAFVHPSSTGGLLLELVQRLEQSGPE